MMWWPKLLLFSLAFTVCNTEKVIIIGAGAAGMAAGVRLLQNDFTDFLILEAEDRIGGRVNSIKLGNAYVDLGAEYVHGTTNNIVYNLAKNVLQPTTVDSVRAYLSDGTTIDDDITQNIIVNVTHHGLSSLASPENRHLTFGEAFLKIYNSRILNQYENNPTDKTLADDFLSVCEKEVCLYEGCLNWNQPAAGTSYRFNDGQGDHSWYGLGYHAVFEILENAYLNQEAIEDFHQNKIIFNKAVNFINFSSINQIELPCLDKSVYVAEHVIVTASLGEEKVYINHTESRTSEKLQNAINTLGFSGVIKILVEFPSHWWDKDGTEYYLVWRKEDRESLDSKFDWVDHMYSFKQAPNNPTVMSIWTVGPMVSKIEALAEDDLKEGLMFVLNTFFGKEFNVEDPIQIVISSWNTSPIYNGTYSYDTLESIDTDARELLATPITDKNGIPRLIIAGEATHSTLHSTVHGAIETGFRAVDQLLPYLQNSGN